MSIAVDPMRPLSMEDREKILEEIKGCQAKVRWFDQELNKLKQVFRGRALKRKDLPRHKWKRLEYGKQREYHQRRIRELKEKLRSRKES